MASESFLTIRVGCCRDLLYVRHRARQIAQILSFSPQDCICIAAGAYMVAQRARKLLRRADIGFSLTDGHLRVFALPVKSEFTAPGESLTLVKLLPKADPKLAVPDVAWLIRQVQLLAPLALEEEVSKQNHEVLLLLSWLGGGAISRNSAADPSAA